MLFNSYEFIFLYLPIVLGKNMNLLLHGWFCHQSFFMAIGIADMYHYFWPQYVLTI